MNTLLDKKILAFGFFAALLMEATSFIAFFLPEYRLTLALVLLGVFAAVTFRDIRLGLYLLFAELAIGGHGYFIGIPIFGSVIALRHLWFIILLCIAAGFHWRAIIAAIKQETIIHRLVFVGAIALLSVGIAYGRGYPLGDIFSDGNAYLFYLLIFPVLLYSKRISKEGIINVLLGALLIMSLKTILTLAIFSNGLLLASQWYLWVRDLRFGEITYINLSFFRVFFQSQALLLPALVCIASYLLHAGPSVQREERRYLLVITSTLLASFILSLSRSFWVGAFAGVIASLWLLFAYRRQLLKNLKAVFTHFIAATFFALVLLSAAQSFSLDTSALLYRFSDLENEPAAASRWSLLPVMLADIAKSPVFGNGFGHTVTYITDDPRIITESGGSGVYTTYALEWGYLDIWLKMGLVGLLALIYLLWYFLALQLKNMRQNASNWYAYAMSVSLIMLYTLHFFTPYLNHPIGIGYLALGLL